MMPHLAVIFDLDGVIIDSHAVAYDLLGNSAQRFGCNVSAEEIRAWGSLSSRQFWTRIKANYGLTHSLDELVASYDENEEIALYQDMRPIAGIPELIGSLSRLSVPIGLATSASRKRTSAVLDLFRIGSFFSAVVCDDDVHASKPDPAVYLEAGRRLGVSPDRCVVIEDSANGIAAAHNAGMKCVGFAGLAHVKEDLQTADLVVTEMRALNFEILRVILERQKVEHT